MHLQILEFRMSTTLPEFFIYECIKKQMTEIELNLIFPFLKDQFVH